MAATYTHSFTVSVPRLALLRFQVAAALRRGTGIDDRALASIRRGLDERWIAHVFLHGFDSGDECRAELALDIDWDRYELAMRRGHSMVEIDGSWRDRVAPEIDEAVVEFVDFCRSRSLRREWRVGYSALVTSGLRAQVDRELGFQPAPPIAWGGTGHSINFRVRELEDLGGRLRLVD
ncbi:hypothetical protein [Pimelobacter simplex]|uniref:hypothetical protein n=1 Tax=Nocardioides simplex TaxID=2045 RepID=UPI003AAE34A0